MKEHKTRLRRWLVSLAVLLLLVATFVLVVYAASRITREVKQNYFQTGTIDINLNDGKAIITEDEYLFEPGMTVRKDFFIENRGTWAVYYKIYFGDIKGELADVLEVEVRDKENGTVLYSGLLRDMTQLRTDLADDVLEVGERRNMTVTFHFPEEKGNETQERSVEFTICATAVQTKNNPNKEGA